MGQKRDLAGRHSQEHFGVGVQEHIQLGRRAAGLEMIVQSPGQQLGIGPEEELLQIQEIEFQEGFLKLLEIGLENRLVPGKGLPEDGLNPVRADRHAERPGSEPHEAVESVGVQGNGRQTAAQPEVIEHAGQGAARGISAEIMESVVDLKAPAVVVAEERGGSFGLLDHGHAPPAKGQKDGGRQAAETGPYHDHVFHVSAFKPGPEPPHGGGPRPRCASRVDPAVDGEDLAGDVAGLLGAEETDQGGHFLGPAQAPERDARQDPVHGQAGDHLGLDEAGGHGVDQDAAPGDLLGQGFGRPDEARLGRRVVDLSGHAAQPRYRGDGYDPPLAAVDHGLDDGPGDVEESA